MGGRVWRESGDELGDEAGPEGREGVFVFVLGGRGSVEHVFDEEGGIPGEEFVVETGGGGGVGSELGEEELGGGVEGRGGREKEEGVLDRLCDEEDGGEFGEVGGVAHGGGVRCVCCVRCVLSDERCEKHEARSAKR